MAAPKPPKTPPRDTVPGPSPKPPDTVMLPLSVAQAQVTLAIVTQAHVPNSAGKQIQGQVQQLLENVLSSVAPPSPPPKET